MEENFRNKLAFITFIIIIILLLVGGNYLKNNLRFNKEDKKEIKKEVSYKIDEVKDYFYYINEQVISESAEINYKDVVINIKGYEHLTERLEKENKIFKNNIKYLSDVTLLSDKLINYNNDNLYALTFRNYKNYEYNKYVSLLINEYNYSCFDLITFNKVDSYIFNVKNGELLNNEDILRIYNTNIDDIKIKINDYLISKESEEIDIDSTLELTNYALFINNLGKLNISFVVKTNESMYNEVMEVI